MRGVKVNNRKRHLQQTIRRYNKRYEANDIRYEANDIFNIVYTVLN
jgi:hypothetical protein